MQNERMRLLMRDIYQESRFLGYTIYCIGFFYESNSIKKVILIHLILGIHLVGLTEGVVIYVPRYKSPSSIHQNERRAIAEFSPVSVAGFFDIVCPDTTYFVLRYLTNVGTN